MDQNVITTAPRPHLPFLGFPEVWPSSGALGGDRVPFRPRVAIADDGNAFFECLGSFPEEDILGRSDAGARELVCGLLTSRRGDCATYDIAMESPGIVHARDSVGTLLHLVRLAGPLYVSARRISAGWELLFLLRYERFALTETSAN